MIFCSELLLAPRNEHELLAVICALLLQILPSSGGAYVVVTGYSPPRTLFLTRM